MEYNIGFEDDIYDITVVGAGPAGLYGLYYAGMRDMKAKVIDILPELGGQLAALYPEKFIYDVPGFRRVLAKDLVAGLKEQALQYDPTICLNEKVVDLSHEDGLLSLVTDAGKVHFTRTVLIAAGAGAFVPRKLDVPRIDELEGRGVYYFVRDLEQFRGQRLMIVGGGDSAVDWALMFENIARSVTLIHRRDRFRAHEKQVEELMRSNVEIKLFSELKALHGEDRIEAVTTLENKTGRETYQEVDAVLMNIGFLANLGPIRSWGLTLSKNNIAVDHQMQTSIPGVFAAGDISDHPGHLKLIAVGSAEAAMAVNYAKHIVDPESSVQPMHSTYKGS